MADVAGGTPEGAGHLASRAFWDAAQVAPVRPRAREALLAALDEGWADPDRLHREGRRARLLLDGARESVAASVGARTEEVALTGSHAAAVHAALLGVLAGRSRTGAGVVHSVVEHSAVLSCAGWHASRSQVPAVAAAVDARGRVDVDAFTAAVRAPGVAVAALQSANGEVGTRQPVDDVLAVCRDAGVPLVVDGAASLGHEPLPGYDLLAADARAFGAPPGTGVLVVRSGVRWRSPSPPDPSVPADRPGVPGGSGVPQALAAAVALEEAVAEREASDAVRRAATARLREQVPLVAPDVEVVGDADDRLPHVLTFSCLLADGEALVEGLDAVGFAVGSGSACTSSTLDPSHVLAAMGSLTHGNVRVGVPATTDGAALEAQVDRFLAVLPGVLAGVRDRLGTSGL